LALPVLAKPEPPDDCKLLFPSIINNPETYNLNLRLPGEYTYIGWGDDGKLINICEGNIPFGEAINPGLTWIVYTNLDGLGRWVWADNVATFTVEEEEEFSWAWVYDTDGSMYRSTSALVEVYPAGNFVFYKYYNPDLE
jgi:hypothetical protein